jgi:hypothetical protein
MEKFPPFFPHHGKFFRIYSMLWKTFFHTMENLPPFPLCPPSAGRGSAEKDFEKRSVLAAK